MSSCSSISYPLPGGKIQEAQPCVLYFHSQKQMPSINYYHTSDSTFATTQSMQNRTRFSKRRGRKLSACKPASPDLELPNCEHVRHTKIHREARHCSPPTHSNTHASPHLAIVSFIPTPFRTFVQSYANDLIPFEGEMGYAQAVRGNLVLLSLMHCRTSRLMYFAFT